MTKLRRLQREYWVQMEAVAAFDQMLTDLWPQRTIEVGRRVILEMMAYAGRHEDCRQLSGIFDRERAREKMGKLVQFPSPSKR